MKIEIEVEDISLFAKALNNACAAYGNVIWRIRLGCEVPNRFEVLKVLPEEELQARADCLKNVYDQVEKLERQ